MRLPAVRVATVRFQPLAAGNRDDWNRLLAMKAYSDVLAVSKGESIDYEKGTIHDVSDATVRFELDGDVVKVKRGKVFGLIYQHAVDPAPPSRSVG